MLQHLILHQQDLQCITSDFSRATTHEQQCYIATEKCEGDYLYSNYSQVTYCWLGGSIFTTLIMSAFVGYLVYNSISEVIKEYLIPCLEVVQKKYEVSEVMAGVTLLAFGNGAGDVLTALVASSYPGGLDYNIGATMGAGFFLCSIGVYIIVSKSKIAIKMNPTIIWRNIGFQIISIFVIMFFGVLGQISVFSSLMLTILYLILVSLVYYQERTKIQNQKKLTSSGPSQQNIPQVGQVLGFDEQLQDGPQSWGTPRSNGNDIPQQQAQDDVKTKQNISIAEKVREVIFYPLNQYVFKYTLPPCKEETFTKNHCIIFPIPGIMLFTSVMFSFPAWWVYFLALMAGFGATIYINTSVPSEKTPPTYFFKLQLIAIVLCLVWIFFLSGLLVDFIQFWAMITKLNKTYLGFSIIAGGNVIPDCISLIALAESGQAITALNGIYFGQLFTNLVGFSIAFLKQNYLNWGPIEFQLFSILKIEENGFKLIVILGALANLILTLILAVKSHYRINKFMAELLSIIYLTFFLIASTSAVYHAWKS